MIVYHPAFDLYHATYRIMLLLSYFNEAGRGEQIEIDRLRIWDYYFIFPQKMINISPIKRDEQQIKGLIKQISTYSDSKNEYELILDEKKLFEKIYPYQMSAIKCLASYGIINVDYPTTNKVKIISPNIKNYATNAFNNLTDKERNVIKLLTSFFYTMPLNGIEGLKDRTNLIESKYDI